MNNKNRLLMLGLALGLHIASLDAMGGARQFARKVFLSKTAAGAGLLTMGLMTAKSAAVYQLGQQINEAPNPLSQTAQQKVREHFEKWGISDVKIVEMERPGMVGPSAYSFFGVNAIVMPRHCVEALEGTTPGASTHDLNEQEALALLEHEASHLRHRDGAKALVSDSLPSPAAVMAWKAVRVAGGSKKIAALMACTKWLGLSLLQRKHCRWHEQRADDTVAPKNAGHLASALEKILPSVRQQFIDVYNKNAEEENERSYEQLDAETREQVLKAHERVVALHELTASHPPVEDRIARAQARFDAYQKEQAAKELQQGQGK